MRTVLEGESAAIAEESVSMTQFLGEFSPESENGAEFLGLIDDQSDFWLGHANMASRVDDDSFVYTSDPSFSNVCFSSQETSTYSGSDGHGDIYNSLLSSSQGFYYQQGRDSNQIFATNDALHFFNSVDFGFEEDENASSGAYVCTAMQLDEEGSNQLKNNAKVEVLVDESPFSSIAFHGTKLEVQVFDNTAEGRGANPPAELEKRPRKAEAQKNKRNVKPRKSKKTEINNVDDESSYQLLTQTSSSNCLKDDVETSNLTLTGSLPRRGNGKTRANRGSATDPQSLYARKRREKINDRLRILQGLVPNGTKVDISTMLDEAVQYVKFLQLQIKLLSSDDMWMYAPLAYNGMDLGLSIEI